MSRFRRNKDASHSVVVDAFRRAGASVLVIDCSAAGAPDLLVGVAGRSLLVEVKNPAGKGMDKRRTRLAPAQEAFAASWRGSPVHVVCSAVEAFELANLMRLAVQPAQRLLATNKPPRSKR